MKVQVVMPSFNRPRLVQQAIKSVQAQTMKSWKLYIMDNSSPNLWSQMKEVYAKFTESDNRILVDHTDVKNEERFKGGKGRPWHWLAMVTNKALFELSEGEPYVTLSTDDDLMMPNKLEVLTKFLDEHPKAMMVAGRMELIDDNGSTVRRYGGRDHPCGYGAYDWMQPMYRREVIQKVGKLQGDGIISMDANFFNQVGCVLKSYEPPEYLHGIPVALDRQYQRTKDTYVHGDRAKKALRGERMDDWLK